MNRRLPRTARIVAWVIVAILSVTPLLVLHAQTADDDPPVEDMDNDGLPDWWEINWFGDLNQDAIGDWDNDGCNNRCELLSGTHPRHHDTDNDGHEDWIEIYYYGTSPFNPDTDGDDKYCAQRAQQGDPCNPGTWVGYDPTLPDHDYISGTFIEGEYLTGDYAEVTKRVIDILPEYPEYDIEPYYTDPKLVDTDGDGLTDYEELYVSCYLSDPSSRSNPLNPDTDNDGVSDGEECSFGSDPHLTDTDGDGLTDYEEIVIYLTNPLLWDTDADDISDGGEVNDHLPTPPHRTNPLNPDTDADGLGDGAEVLMFGTDALRRDTDGDGLIDGAEVNIYGTTPTLIDTDGDGLTDGDEINVYGTNPLVSDSDDDGVSDGDEINRCGTDPLDPLDFCDTTPVDGDQDGLPDAWEMQRFGHLNYSWNDDVDQPQPDGLVNGLELLLGTDPTDPDTDDDGLLDGAEVNNHGTNPNNADTDDDGLTDWEEVTGAHGYLTSPHNPDTDFDGLTDWQEIFTYNTDPTDPDSDDDGLNDGQEVLAHLTNPKDPDTDDDGLIDGLEVHFYGTDPLDTDSDDDGLLDGDEVNEHGTHPAKADTDDDGATDYDELFVCLTDPLDPDSDDDGVLDGEECDSEGDPQVTVTWAVTVPTFTPSGPIYLLPEVDDEVLVAVEMTNSGPNTWTHMMILDEGAEVTYTYSRGSANTQATEADGEALFSATFTVEGIGGDPQSINNTIDNWLDPIVLSSTPADGANDQPVNTPISVQFSKPINASNPASTFSVVNSDDQPVTGTFAYDEATATLTFTPNPDFRHDDTIFVTVAGVQGAPSGVQQGTFSFTFTTLDFTPPLSELELLVNGDFEADPANKVLLPWQVVNKTKDKLKCLDMPRDFQTVSGLCAFKFKGGIGENSTLQQTVDPTGLTLAAGDELILSAFLDSDSAVDLKLKLKVKYVSGVTDGQLLAVTPTDGYVELTVPTLVLNDAAVEKIKVLFKHKSLSGKSFLDDVSLKLRQSDGQRSRDGSGMLPMPSAPIGSEWRGN